ncbi:hypothetical protein [Paenibacillus sp. Z6-24]
MDTTVCPWCHSEIVWDPEFGPEESCPHCGNELNGYRTLNIDLDEGEEEEQQYEAAVRAAQQEQKPERESSIASRATTLLDEAELFHQPNLSSLKTIEKYGDENFNMVDYEENVERLLDKQEEIPQCPHCQEYMLLAGTQEHGASGFVPNQSAGKELAFLQAPFKVNMYVCPSCFHVHQSLGEEERLRMIDHLTRHQDNK